MEAGEGGAGLVPGCGLGWADHREELQGGSEEDNPPAAMKGAAVGVRAWHCRGLLLLLGSGYQQRSGSPGGWAK